MNDTSNIAGYLSVAGAARRIGVGEHRVRALVRQGDIDAVRVSERGMLIDAVSLEAYKRIAPEAGRPYGFKVAFGLLWMLSGIQAPWLDYHQTRRCKKALRKVDVDALIRGCRKRARAVRLRVSPSFFPSATDHMILSGTSALDSYEFDLTRDAGTLEGYSTEKDLGLLIDECFAVPDAQGNVIVHVVEELPEHPGGVMPVAVAALDLAESLETRQRACGRKKLGALIGAANE